MKKLIAKILLVTIINALFITVAYADDSLPDVPDYQLQDPSASDSSTSGLEGALSGDGNSAFDPNSYAGTFTDDMQLDPQNLIRIQGELDNKMKLFASDLDNDPCIELEKEDGKPGKDAGYIYTILEEPLTQEQIESNDYKTRLCYRNTFSYRIAGFSPSITSELAEKCSTTGQDIFAQYYNTAKNDDNIEISFTCQEVQILLSKGGTSGLTVYIAILYRWATRVAGLIAVVVIIISAIQISVAGGESGAIDSAKTRIGQSLAGLALLFLSGLLLHSINPNFYIF